MRQLAGPPAILLSTGFSLLRSVLVERTSCVVPVGLRPAARLFFFYPIISWTTCASSGPVKRLSNPL